MSTPSSNEDNNGEAAEVVPAYEAARLVGCSRQYVNKLIQRKRIPVVARYGRYAIMVRMEDVRAAIMGSRGEIGRRLKAQETRTEGTRDVVGVGR